MSQYLQHISKHTIHTLLTALTWEGRQEAQIIRSSTNLDSMRCSDDSLKPKLTVFEADTFNHLDFLVSKQSLGSNVAIPSRVDSGLPTKN